MLRNPLRTASVVSLKLYHTHQGNVSVDIASIITVRACCAQYTLNAVSPPPPRYRLLNKGPSQLTTQHRVRVVLDFNRAGAAFAIQRVRREWSR